MATQAQPNPRPSGLPAPYPKGGPVPASKPTFPAGASVPMGQQGQEVNTGSSPVMAKSAHLGRPVLPHGSNLAKAS